MQIIIGQILGILATIIGVSSFQVNNKKHLLLIQSVSTILTCISYLFLGATSGFALNIVCLARNIVFCFSKKDRKLEYLLTGAFMLLMGFIGALFLICVFIFFIFRGIVIGLRAPDKFSSMLVIGIIMHVGIQVILNIAVVTNTLPSTGISLPFFSYGGTSLIILLAEMGVVMSVSRMSQIEKT